MPSPNVNDSIAVSEGVYPLLGIGVSEYVELRFRQLLINVNDSVGLSKLMIVSSDCEVVDSASVSIVTANAIAPNVADNLQISDDGQGVALQGGPGAIIQITAIDNVGLSRMFMAGEYVSISESIAVSFASNGPRLLNVFDSIAVTEQVWLGPFDYVFVTESCSVYFRTIIPSAHDAVSLAELTTLLIQGGTGAAVQLNVSEGVSLSESHTVAVPALINVREQLFVFDPPTVMVPPMPAPAETVAVSESVTVLIGKVLVNVNEAITASESVDLRFSRLFINSAEDISVVESNGISRPSQPWEAGADSSTTWNGSGSTSDDWEPGAVEETVWA